MSTLIESLLQRQDEELKTYVASAGDRAVDNLLNKIWRAVRKGNLYAGQPRNSNSQRSLLLARLAVSLSRYSGKPRHIAEAQRMMAYALNANEQFEESVNYYYRAIAALEETGNFQLAARTRLGLLFALSMTERYDKAIQIAQEADQWFISNKDVVGHARLCVNLGTAYHRIDEHERSAECANAAIKIFETLNDQTALAQCHLNLGDSLSMLGCCLEADRNFALAEKLSRSAGLKELHFQARYNRSYLSFLRGRYSEAIAGFQDLRSHFVSHGSRRHGALCDLDEAEIYLHLNLPKDALTLSIRAAESFRILKMDYEYAKAIAFRGVGLAQRQHFADALRAFELSHKIFERQKNQLWIASLEMYRAEVLFLIGKPDEAHPWALSANARLGTLNIPSKKAMSLILLVRIELELGQSSKAEADIAEILQLIRQAQLPLHLFPCYSTCAEVAERSGEIDRAYGFYELAAQDIEVNRAHLHHDELRVNYLKDKQQVYESLVRLSLGGNRAEKLARAYEWCERAKSRGLIDLLSQHFLLIEPRGEPALSRRINQLREEINSYYIRSQTGTQSGQPSPGAADIEAKKDELARSVRALAPRVPEYASLQQVSIFSVEAVQKTLPKGCALLEYFIAGDEIMAFVVTRMDARLRSDLRRVSDVKHLQSLLRFQLDKFALGQEYLAAYRSELLAATQHHLHELYSALLAPVIENVAAKHLFIVPHGPLHYLPFHAFYDGETYLIDRYSVSYAPSASVLRHCLKKKDVDVSSSLIIGVADKFAPFVENEIAALNVIASDATVFSGRRATRNAFRKRSARADFVHVATHAVFRHNDPMSSGFKLVDGWINALDLYSMSCDTNLVTLSGCQSGMSHVAGGDELMGLMRGFLYAGARSLLLSLWNVNDRSTSRFMEIFYGYWLKGTSKSKALQAAICEIRRDEPHPFFWAPFLLVGKP